MLGVAGRADASTFNEWVESRGVAAFDHIADDDGSVWGEFGIRTQPAFVFINDDGTFEAVNGRLGTDSLTERITALIES